MIKNNIFDKNANLNSSINYPKKKFIDGNRPSHVVNLDVLSDGVKTDLDIQKVGSDTRSYLEYRESIDSRTKNLKKR